MAKRAFCVRASGTNKAGKKQVSLFCYKDKASRDKALAKFKNKRGWTATSENR